MRTGSRVNNGKHAGCKGFTLIELAIVIVVVGILTVPLFRLHDQYLMEKVRRVTKENVQISNAEIATFFSNESRYPCPADRSLAQNDPNYGREYANCDPPTIAAMAINTCIAGGGLCKVEGARDADGDGNNDPVLIGAVPVTSLRDSSVMAWGGDQEISDDIMLDGWDHLLTYAVTVSLTNASTYQFYNGVIKAVDEHGNPTAGIDEDGHYVIVSNGPNGQGAYSRDGVLIANCTMTITGPPPPGPPIVTAYDETENCDDADGTFVQGLDLMTADQENYQNYYDDYVFFSQSQVSSLWAYVQSAGNSTNHIYNLNTRNVGIGTESPATALEVAGDIKADNVTELTEICTKDGSKCFNVNVIAGDDPSMECPAGEVFVGITNGQRDCDPPTFSPLTTNFTCPAGGWVHGIRTDGSVICWP